MIRLLITIFVATLLTGVATPQSPTSFFAANRWAIVIGASDYPELGKLPYAANDAESFSTALINEYKFEQDKVITLTDQRKSDQEKPTVARINQVLNQVLTDPRLSQGDLLVFFFSGHGLGTQGTDLLLPTDATYENAEEVGLPVKSIIQRVVKSGVRNVLFIADACRSGSKNPFGTELVTLGREANISILLGCAPGGRSYEIPRSQQGAMTNALVSAIKDPTLRDPLSGSLWASTIAEKVKADVEDTTARLQGQEDRQIPSIYCRKNQDILLGGFVGRGGVNQDTFAQIVAQGKDLNKEVYGSYLWGLALAAAESGDQDIAINALRTMRELGEYWSGSLALEASTLATIGREQEANSLFKKLTTEFPEAYHSYLFRALNSPTPESRKTATMAMWNKFKDMDSAMAWFVYLRTNPTTKTQDYRDFATVVLDEFPEESGPWQFFATLEYSLDLEPDEILKQIQDNPVIPDLPGVRKEYIELLLYHIATRTKDPEVVLATINILRQNPVSAAIWEDLERPWILMLPPPKDLREAITNLLDSAVSGERVYTAVCFAGNLSDDFVPEFEAAAARFPYSARAQAAVWFAKLMKEAPKTFTFPEELKVLGYDRPDLLAELYQQVLDASISFWAFPNPDAAVNYQRQILYDLIQNPAPQHSTWWKTVTNTTLVMGRENILQSILNNHPNPINDNLWAQVKTTVPLYQGDLEAAHKALKQTTPLLLQFAPGIYNELAFHYILNGDHNTADKILAERATQFPDSPNPALPAIELYKQATSNSPPTDTITFPTEDSTLISLINTLSKIKLNQLEYQQLRNFALDGPRNNPFIQAEILKAFAPIAKGKDDIYFLHNTLLSLSGNAYKSVPLPGPAFPTQSGSLTLVGEMFWCNSPDYPVTASLNWIDGKITITITPDEDKTKPIITLKGTITPTGFITATGNINNTPTTYTTRLAHPDYWNENKTMTTVGTFLQPNSSFGDTYLSIERFVIKPYKPPSGPK